MGNVSNPGKQQQVLALGWLDWSLPRIEAPTSVRRETASAYLKVAGGAVLGRGQPNNGTTRPAISPGAQQVAVSAISVANSCELAGGQRPRSTSRKRVRCSIESPRQSFFSPPDP